MILGPAALALPFGLALAAVLVRYPPALLVSYGYIGIFKGEPLVADLPFDVTLALGVLLTLVCLHRLIEGRVRPVPAAYLALLLLIGCMLAVSLTWTPMAEYGTEKVLKFFSFTAVAALAPFFIIEDRRDLVHLLWATVALAIFSAGVALANPVPRRRAGGWSSAATRTRSSPRACCVPGRSSSLFAPGLGLPRPLAAARAAARRRARRRGEQHRLARPDRQPCAGALVRRCGVDREKPSATRLGTGDRRRRNRDLPVRPPPGDLQGAARGHGSQPLADPGAGRALAALRQGGRADRENPVLGFGSGGFFLYSYVLLEQEEKYPHNVFLELSAEVGLGPALALAAAVLFLLFSIGRRAWTAKDDRDRRLVFLLGGLFLINLFAVQFSGDINDNRVFWTMFGVAWLVARYGLPDRDQGPWLELGRRA